MTHYLSAPLSIYRVRQNGDREYLGRDGRTVFSKVIIRRPGRPSGKRGNFTFRTTVRLREQLEAEAAASGRSVSGEIEFRLERTFIEDYERQR